MYTKGDAVEVKGFGKWEGASLDGEIVEYCDEGFYIVQLWGIIDPDYDGDYDDKPKDDEYYFRKQEEYQIIHPHLIREPVREESGKEFNIGDVIDWNDLCILRKGTVIGKTYCANTRITARDAKWLYEIKLEESDEIVEDHSCRMRPHQPWP